MRREKGVYSYIGYNEEAVEGSSEPDFFTQKLDHANYKKQLIIYDIQERDRLKNENLARLYDELLKLDNWRLQHDPNGYLHDKTWQEHNKMELDLRKEIRRELKESARDVAFPGKDLRESRLEYKIQKNKSDMLGGGFGGLEIELDSSEKYPRGDSYLPQTYG